MRLLFLCLLLAVSAGLSAQTLTTAITYQGELEFQGQPAQGTYDFEFLLFDAETSGNLVTTLVVEDVPVQAGLFSVELDFGPGVFIGEDRWLELGVRAGASTGGFTGLLPRQTLTPAPFALHAEGVAAEAVGTIEIEDGSITADDLGSGTVGAVAINPDEVQVRISGTCPSGQAVVSVGQDGQVSCASAADPTEFNGVDPIGSAQNIGPQQADDSAWVILDTFTVTSGDQDGEVLAIGNALARCANCGQSNVVTCQTSLIESTFGGVPASIGTAVLLPNLSSNIVSVQEFSHPANTTASYSLIGIVAGGSAPGLECEFRFISVGGVFQPN